MKNKPKAIIVDDEDCVRDLLAKLLTTWGFDIIGKGVNGEQAITMFRKYKPELMFLDINMPIKNGYEVLQTLQGEYKDTCIIMLTSVTDMQTVKKFLKLKVSYFIRKDTPWPEMQKLINNAWNSFNYSRSLSDRTKVIDDKLDDILT